METAKQSIEGERVSRKKKIVYSQDRSRVVKYSKLEKVQNCFKQKSLLHSVEHQSEFGQGDASTFITTAPVGVRSPHDSTVLPRSQGGSQSFNATFVNHKAENSARSKDKQSIKKPEVININSIKSTNGKPRVPQRYDELQLMHKTKIKEIIDANLKKTYEKITEEAR